MDAVLRAALAAVDAGELVSKALGVHDLSQFSGCRLIAVGKAAGPMAKAAVRTIGSQTRGGLLIAPDPVPAHEPLQLVVAGHPTPTQRSEEAGLRALMLARETRKGECLLVLLSGGASALMAVPAAGISLEDKGRTTDLLLRRGADIHALNTVRKHLSGIKGGQLAAASSAASWTFAISDVVGDDLGVIGSGPTVADSSTFADALGVLERLGGPAGHPQSVVRHLERGVRGDLAETPKPGDVRLKNATAWVIGGRQDAARGAADEARSRGYHTVIREAAVVGEARHAAVSYLEWAADRARDLPRPLAIISSGETTVLVKGGGRGGRNQEFTLAAASGLVPFGPAAALASIGTDGIDGPTDAAGAVANTTTLLRATEKGLASVEAFLADNDAYSFFEPLGDLIRTGPTGTNVGDLQVLLVR